MLASSWLVRLGKDLLSERAIMCPSCPVAFRLSSAAVKRDTPCRRCLGSCSRVHFALQSPTVSNTQPDTNREMRLRITFA